MTVTYTSEVTTCRGFSSFLKLLARWRGSIYKIVWVDLLIFLTFYYIINISYRFTSDHSKLYFEKVVKYCDKYSNLVPLSFILGFYVSLVMTRWWNQYCSIPFPDNLAITVGACVKGQHDRARVVRRTIARYACATFTITLTMLSPKVKKRFPTYEHFVGAGLLTKDEVRIMEDLDNELPGFSKYWLPLAWAANVVTRSRLEGLVRDDESVKSILDELNTLRSKCGGMLDYDWISVPLMYTQVVTLVVYSYFIVSAIGKQQTTNDDVDIDLYFPFFLVLEFFFYMGWLKVAEVLINPYGDDDDDFEVVWMVDRHLQVCYLLVDKIHEEHPKLTRDPHWSETIPNSLPFTVASKDYMQEYPFSSTLNIKVSRAQQQVIMPVDDSTTQIDGMKRRSKAYGYVKTVIGAPLTQVVSYENPDNESSDDVGDNESVPVNQPQVQDNSCDEFDALKRARIEERRRKLQQFVNLTIKEKSDINT